MSVVPHDAPDIANEDILLRRIIPSEHLVPDGNTGQLRLSTKAFSPSSEENGGMSVDIEKFIIAANLDPKTFVTSPRFSGSVQFTAGSARSAGLLVGKDPLPENPYHGEVWGNNKPNRFSKGQQNILLRSSEWYVEIPEAILKK